MKSEMETIEGGNNSRRRVENRFVMGYDKWLGWL